MAIVSKQSEANVMNGSMRCDLSLNSKLRAKSSGDFRMTDFVFSSSFDHRVFISRPQLRAVSTLRLLEYGHCFPVRKLLRSSNLPK